MMRFAGFILIFLLGGCLDMSSYTISNTKSLEKSAHDFDFELTSEMTAGTHADIAWSEDILVASVSVELLDNVGKVLFRLDGVQGTSTKIYIADPGTYFLKLTAYLADGEIYSTRKKSILVVPVGAESQGIQSDPVKQGHTTAGSDKNGGGTDLVSVVTTPVIEFNSHLSLSVGSRATVKPTKLILRNIAVKSCAITPSLPAWANFDGDRCEFSGVPSAPLSPTAFTVTVTNVQNETAAASFELEVLTHFTWSADFANAGSMISQIGPNLELERASEATYFDIDGQIKLAGIHSPRFEHRYVDGSWKRVGLLINAAGTTIAERGNNFVHNIWNYKDGSTVTASDETPLGPLVPMTLVEAKHTEEAHIIGSSDSKNRSSCYSVNCRFSFFVQSKGAVNVHIGQVTNEGLSHNTSVDMSLVTGEVTRSGNYVRFFKATQLGDKLWQIDFSIGRPSANGYVIGLSILDESFEQYFLGRPTDKLLIGGWNTFGDSRYVPRSYIPTTTTHQADHIGLSGQSFTDMYKDTGSFEINFSALGFEGERGILSINDGTSDNRLELYFNNRKISFRATVQGAEVASRVLSENLNAETLYKFKWAYNSDTLMFQLDDGTPVVVDGTFERPDVDRLYLGRDTSDRVGGLILESIHYSPKFPEDPSYWY